MVPTMIGMSVSKFVSSSADFCTNLTIDKGSNVCFIDASFNPPSLAHVKLPRLCRDSFHGCYLVFMLGIGNADKPTAPVEQLQQRADMIKIMIDSEFPQDSKAGMALISEPIFVEKSKIVRKHMGDINIIFAMGFDTLIRVADQRYYKLPIEEVLADFFRNCRVLLLTRNQDNVSHTPDIGSSSRQIDLINSSPVFRPFLDRIILHEAQPDTNGVSSSCARSSVENLLRTVPRAVADYILEHKLYDLDYDKKKERIECI